MRNNISDSVGTFPIEIVKPPKGLHVAMEGLAREVIKYNPKDIYKFAADYFEKLLKLREEFTLIGRSTEVQELVKANLHSVKENQSSTKSVPLFYYNKHPSQEKREITSFENPDVVTRQQNDAGFLEATNNKVLTDESPSQAIKINNELESENDDSRQIFENNEPVVEGRIIAGAVAIARGVVFIDNNKIVEAVTDESDGSRNEVFAIDDIKEISLVNSDEEKEELESSNINEEISSQPKAIQENDPQIVLREEDETKEENTETFVSQSNEIQNEKSAENKIDIIRDIDEIEKSESNEQKTDLNIQHISEENEESTEQQSILESITEKEEYTEVENEILQTTSETENDKNDDGLQNDFKSTKSSGEFMKDQQNDTKEHSTINVATEDTDIHIQNDSGNDHEDTNNKDDTETVELAPSNEEIVNPTPITSSDVMEHEGIGEKDNEADINEIKTVQDFEENVVNLDDDSHNAVVSSGCVDPIELIVNTSTDEKIIEDAVINEFNMKDGGKENVNDEANGESVISIETTQNIVSEPNMIQNEKLDVTTNETIHDVDNAVENEEPDIKHEEIPVITEGEDSSMNKDVAENENVIIEGEDSSTNKDIAENETILINAEAIANNLPNNFSENEQIEGDTDKNDKNIIEENNSDLIETAIITNDVISHYSEDNVDTVDKPISKNGEEFHESTSDIDDKIENNNSNELDVENKESENIDNVVNEEKIQREEIVVEHSSNNNNLENRIESASEDLGTLSRALEDNEEQCAESIQDREPDIINSDEIENSSEVIEINESKILTEGDKEPENHDDKSEQEIINKSKDAEVAIVTTDANEDSIDENNTLTEIESIDQVPDEVNKDKIEEYNSFSTENNINVNDEIYLSKENSQTQAYDGGNDDEVSIKNRFGSPSNDLNEDGIENFQNEDKNESITTPEFIDESAKNEGEVENSLNQTDLAVVSKELMDNNPEKVPDENSQVNDMIEISEAEKDTSSEEITIIEDKAATNSENLVETSVNLEDTKSADLIISKILLDAIEDTENGLKDSSLVETIAQTKEEAIFLNKLSEEIDNSNDQEADQTVKEFNIHDSNVVDDFSEIYEENAKNVVDDQNIDPITANGVSDEHQRMSNDLMTDISPVDGLKNVLDITSDFIRNEREQQHQINTEEEAIPKPEAIHIRDDVVAIDESEVKLVNASGLQSSFDMSTVENNINDHIIANDESVVHDSDMSFHLEPVDLKTSIEEEGDEKSVIEVEILQKHTYDTRVLENTSELETIDDTNEKVLIQENQQEDINEKTVLSDEGVQQFQEDELNDSIAVNKISAASTEESELHVSSYKENSNDESEDAIEKEIMTDGSDKKHDEMNLTNLEQVVEDFITFEKFHTDVVNSASGKSQPNIINSPERKVSDSSSANSEAFNIDKDSIIIQDIVSLNNFENNKIILILHAEINDNMTKNRNVKRSMSLQENERSDGGFITGASVDDLIMNKLTNEYNKYHGNIFANASDSSDNATVEKDNDKPDSQDNIEEPIVATTQSDSYLVGIGEKNVETDESSGKTVESTTPREDPSDDDFVNERNIFEKASIVIQKVFRGFRVRKNMKTEFETTARRKNSNEEEIFAKIEEPILEVYNLSDVESIDTDLKQRLNILMRSTSYHSPIDSKLYTVSEEKNLSSTDEESSTFSSAATKIQAGVRGFLTRKYFQRNKTGNSSDTTAPSIGEDSRSIEEYPTPGDVKSSADDSLSKIVVTTSTILMEQLEHFDNMETAVNPREIPDINLTEVHKENDESMSRAIQNRKRLRREDAIQVHSPFSSGETPSNKQPSKVSEEDEQIGELAQSIITEIEANNYTPVVHIKPNANTPSPVGKDIVLDASDDDVRSISEKESTKMETVQSLDIEDYGGIEEIKSQIDKVVTPSDDSSNSDSNDPVTTKMFYDKRIPRKLPRYVSADIETLVSKHILEDVDQTMTATMEDSDVNFEQNEENSPPVEGILHSSEFHDTVVLPTKIVRKNDVQKDS